MKKEIITQVTGNIVLLTSGAVSLGSLLFTTECMKMDVNQYSNLSGIFEAAVAIGTAVIAGETIIGYLTTSEE